MNSLKDELKHVLLLYNKLEYHKSLDLAFKLLGRLDSNNAESDISDKLNLIISRILFLQGRYEESISYVNNCTENEQSLLMRAKIFSTYNYYLCKNTYYWLLIYNDKYITQFINCCLDEVDLGFLYILSIYKPISVNEINNTLATFVNTWNYTTNPPLYKDLLYNYTYLNNIVDIEAQLVNFDFQYANNLNSIISGLDDTKTHKLNFTSESPIIVIKEFIDFISKHGLHVTVDFKLKSKNAVSTLVEDSKSNRQRDSSRRQKTIESTHWHCFMPTKLFNSLSKLVSQGDSPKDTYESLSHGYCTNTYYDYNSTLNKIIISTFNKSDLAGFIAFKLFTNLLFRYNYNSLLCTNNEVELIIALITLYKMLDNWINTTVSLFSHPLLSCIYMENSRVPSMIELLWTKFHKIDIFKFMMILVKALSLHKIGYPIPMSEILSVCEFIIKNTLHKHSFIITELNSFTIIMYKWNELLGNRIFYDGFYQCKKSIKKKNNYHPIHHSILFDYFIRTHVPILYMDKVSHSSMVKLSKIYGYGCNYNEIKSRFHTKLLRHLSHQFKLFSMEKYVNDDIHQLLSISNLVLDKSVYHLITKKFKSYGSDLLVSCIDLFNNLILLLVENQLKMNDSFNNPNWVNNREFCSIDVRMGGISVTIICNIVFKIFILVEQFDFNNVVTNINENLQKMVLLSALLIYYELFNLLYIKHHNISSKLDLEQSHMLTSMLLMLIISTLIKSGFYDDNLINIIGVLLQVDHVYRELIDDIIEMKYSSDDLQMMSFKWGFYDTNPNLFDYPLTNRIIHLPTYIINVCTALYNTRLIRSYCTELELSNTNPYGNIHTDLDEDREVELDNWISISFAQTYAINIYIGIPSPFDKSREKIKKYDKSANIPFFKLDIRSAVIAVHIHRYLNGMEMVTDLNSLNSCDYIASHDQTTLENRDLIISLCETINTSTYGFDNAMFYKSLRILYLNLLLGTKLDDPIHPYEKLFFITNNTNITELMTLSENALNALPASHDALFANITLKVKECSLLSNLSECDIDKKELDEKFDNLFKLLQCEIGKYSSNKPIFGPRELSHDRDSILESEFVKSRLEKCYLMYIGLALMNKSFLNDQINTCLSYSLNVLTLLSLNKLPIKGHSISNPNFVSSVLNSIGRIKWNIDKIIEIYDFSTSVSTLLLVGKFLCKVYNYLNLESILKLAMSLYVKSLEISEIALSTNNSTKNTYNRSNENNKIDGNYFSNVLSILESKTGDTYHILQYCYCKCLKMMFKYPKLATDNFEEIIHSIIDNSGKYCNVSNYVAINTIKYNINSNLNNLLQSLSNNFNIIIYFDIFGYGLIKTPINDTYLINSLNSLSLLLEKYIDVILASVQSEIIKCMNEFSVTINNYVNELSEVNIDTKSNGNLGKGKWIVIGYESIDRLDGINSIIETITTILTKIGKQINSQNPQRSNLQNVNLQNLYLIQLLNTIVEKLELLISKCPEALSIPLTYNHFLSKSDCINLIELLKGESSDKSMFSKYTIDTATIDVRLVKNLKLLIGVIFKINNINKSQVYERLCNALINSCQKILYCQPPIDTVETSNPLLYNFVKIDIRQGVTVFASDTWATQQKLNSFRQANIALSSATTPPHTI